MNPENHMAYKEWASVAEALDRGMFAMSLRKGGIHEKRGEFSVEHREYFLFPTFVHQRESDLVPAVLPLLEESKRHAPLEAKEGELLGQITIRHYVTVEYAVYIEDLAKAHALEGLHPFTREAVDMRFNYKKPGLWAIVERVYRLPQPVVIKDDRVYAGCRSWVPLKTPLTTAGATPVLSDADFLKRVQAMRAFLQA